ncbi:binding-protein-dependent transport systems inner membrane component [Beutenbergia cavernae DSM 12333]|uniref:Binding-protein-dependent transport systems inner membrane component n=1 Tax=Beutenbergia cavernae (strain ATCC BAA-8 / DSM 12333 / CCUG 43141 / JCM 11478 / NBRC 16432 / NCIMB 13614 / HKI 0122) TaxID=471853 RepID=C5BV20_BEUC1|nr:carbohydrate ABC transporter permease [Beutenbergia cavernae]ACQ78394.1 binding-protein-dependent transport systems inner membrane component [Beutenbergia cavernae DSM 12333]
MSASATSATLSRRARTPIFLLLVVGVVTVLYPIVFLLTSAFRSNADYLQNPYGLPGELTFRNFVVLWNSYGVGQAVMNSLTVVLIALVVELALAILAGYALAKYDVPGAKLFRAGFVSVMLIPSQVLIIPIYLLLSRLNLVGEFAGLILVYIATGLSFATFFLSLTFRGVPTELLEAARIDGAGFFRTLRSVAAPVGASGIATLAVLQFLAMWNELLFAYILLPDDDKTMLTPALAQIGGRYLSDQPLVSAGLLITALPPLLLLTFASRYVMQGLAAGVVR